MILCNFFIPLLQEETEWQHFLRQCLELIAKVAEIITPETFQILVSLLLFSVYSFGLLALFSNASSEVSDELVHACSGLCSLITSMEVEEVSNHILDLLSH